MGTPTKPTIEVGPHNEQPSRERERMQQGYDGLAAVAQRSTAASSKLLEFVRKMEQTAGYGGLLKMEQTAGYGGLLKMEQTAGYGSLLKMEQTAGYGNLLKPDYGSWIVSGALNVAASMVAVQPPVTGAPVLRSIS